jgi:nitroreductase
MDVIFKRRSIRKYTPQAVSRELLESFIKAGMNAPSAGDEQPWHFVILTDRSIFGEIMKIHPHAGMLATAPAAVLVCGDLSLETNKGYWVQDCAAATENMLLAITAEGLGSVWVGVYPRTQRVEALKKLLHLPEHIVPFSLLPVGYPDEQKPPKDIFLRQRIHENQW